MTFCSCICMKISLIPYAYYSIARLSRQASRRKSFLIVPMLSFPYSWRKLAHSNPKTRRKASAPAELQSLLKYWPAIRTIWKLEDCAPLTARHLTSSLARIQPAGLVGLLLACQANSNNDKIVSRESNRETCDQQQQNRCFWQQSNHKERPDRTTTMRTSCYKVLNVFNINRFSVIGFFRKEEKALSVRRNVEPPAQL